VPSRIGRVRFCSKQCKDLHHSIVMSGENNPAWRGGYQPDYGPSWPEARQAARERDGYTCQQCYALEGDLGKELDVHHIVPFRVFGLVRHEKANSLTNLVSLCASCHARVT